METHLVMHEAVELLPFLALYRTYNTGVAFSMFSWVGDKGLIVLSVAVIAFVLYLAVRSAPGHILARIGFALIISGAIGNLIDRAALRPRDRLHPVPHAGMVVRGVQSCRRFHLRWRGCGRSAGAVQLAACAKTTSSAD